MEKFPSIAIKNIKYGKKPKKSDSKRKPEACSIYEFMESMDIRE
jgi:hypothetical protein